MSTFEDLLLSYLLNSMWQVPLLLGICMVAARLVRRTGPAAEHRVWAGTLVGQVVLPAASLMPWARLHLAWPWQIPAGMMNQASVAVQMGEGTGLGRLLLAPPLMTAIAVAYSCVLAYFAARFAWRCVRLGSLMRWAEPLDPGHDVALSQERWSRLLGVGPVEVRWSARIFAPMTVGYFRKCVLFPSGMLAGLTQPDMDTAIAHELAHVRRNDFLKNVLYELLSLPVSYHPAFWVVRQRMTESREMVCDQMAAELSGSHQYAQSLLRLAGLLLEGKPLGVPHALGVFDANTLERRLMKLTETGKKPGRLRRWAALGACIVLGAAAAFTVVAFRFDVDAAVGGGAGSHKAAPRSIPAETMQKHVLTKVPPKYPPQAKKAGVQGKVVLDVVISKTGRVENVKVVSGPAELQQSALDAVRQWTYRPVLMNGAPIEVETTVNVIYSLAK